MAEEAPAAACTVLLTGCTGFLGSHVLRDLLLLKAQCEVAVVVRARHGKSARHRVRALVHDLSEEFGEQEVDSAPSGGEELTQAEVVSVERKVDTLMERVLVIEGSLDDESLWKRTDLKELAPRLRAIIHCAANVSFDAPLADALRHNTGTTNGVYTYGVMQCTSLRRFVHVGTAYVANSHGNAPIPVSPVDDFAEDVLERVLPLLGVPPYGGSHIWRHCDNLSALRDPSASSTSAQSDDDSTLDTVSTFEEIGRDATSRHGATARACRERVGNRRVHPRLPTLREGTTAAGTRDPDNDLWKAVCGHHPNSYTFSKALSEFLLVRGHRSLWHLSHSGFNTGRPDFDLVIVRPSIISAAADEVLRNPSRPNFAGLNGILALSACGYLHALHCEKELRLNVVPVDGVAHVIVSCVFQPPPTPLQPLPSAPFNLPAKDGVYLVHATADYAHSLSIGQLMRHAAAVFAKYKAPGLMPPSFLRLSAKRDLLYHVLVLMDLVQLKVLCLLPGSEGRNAARTLRSLKAIHNERSSIGFFIRKPFNFTPSPVAQQAGGGLLVGFESEVYCRSVCEAVAGMLERKGAIIPEERAPPFCCSRRTFALFLVLLLLVVCLTVGFQLGLLVVGAAKEFMHKMHEACPCQHMPICPCASKSSIDAEL